MKQTPLIFLAFYGISLAIILLLSFWVYFPGVDGPALLDDYSSLGALGNLSSAPEQAWDYVLGDNSGPLGRSVSMATFVVEHLWSDGTIATSKLVNIAIHLFNGILVTTLLMLLAKGRGIPLAHIAAIVCAGIWLLAPLQVSTVLYLVQRMAMLATTFTLLSLVFYVLWRASASRTVWRSLLLLACVVTLVLGVLSKENAVLCIPLILLVEVCWIQGKSPVSGESARVHHSAYGLILLGVVCLLGFLMLNLTVLEAKYEAREFTLHERALTQPRILWDYVRQFYMPDIHRLGIFHDDIQISSALFAPRSTFWAIAAWIGLVCVGVLVWRWPAGRIAMFGPLFFLTGHAMESTVWPLEMYFEHRNYLPSIGLCLLVFSVYALIAREWGEVSKPLLAWLGVYILFLTLQTSSQVQIWSSAPLLAMQHVNGHPNSARANNELATHLARVGAREGALKYSQKAFNASNEYDAASNEHYGDYILRNLALACIAKAPLTETEYQELGRTEPERPIGSVTTMSVVIKLRQSDACADFDWQGFLDHLGELYLSDVDSSRASANMWSAFAMLANAEQRWEQAYEYNARSLALSPESTRGLLMQLHFTTALNKREEADKYIQQLQGLKEAGKLNRGEQDTLALYLEK